MSQFHYISQKRPGKPLIKLNMSKKEQPVIELNKGQEDALAKSKIEVIKNLIFGENIQAYNSEFEKLKKDILTKKKTLEALIEEVRSELQSAIDDVSTDVNSRIDKLEENLEDKIEDLQTDIVQKEDLGKILIEMGERISKK